MPACYFCMIMVEKEFTFSGRLWEITTSSRCYRFELLASILVNALAAFLRRSRRFIWCDNVGFGQILLGLHGCMIKMAAKMAKCHRTSHAWWNEPQKISALRFFYQFISNLPIIHRPHSVVSLPSPTPSGKRQTLENASPCFCFSHPSLPKFFLSLAGWLQVSKQTSWNMLSVSPSIQPSCWAPKLPSTM